MENLEVDNETTKNTYNKEEIKKELDESLINCERYANTDIEEKATSAEKPKMQQQLFGRWRRS